MKRQKDMALKDELPRSIGAQYTTWEEWRKNSRKNKTSFSEQERSTDMEMGSLFKT